MALVITLLFTGIVLMIIVMTSATLVTGSRGGGADERRAYQALLAAESGLNTIMVRVNQRLISAPYTGSTPADLGRWLGGLNTDAESALFPSTLSFTPVGGDRFTVESRGSASSAVKVVLQDFQLTPVYLPAGLRVRAALTSLPPVNANGSAQISGQSGRGVLTTLTGAGLNASVGTQQVTVTVTDASGLRSGDYVQLPPGSDGPRFRVTGISGAQVQLTSVPAALTSALSAPAGTGVELLLNAAAQTSLSVTDPMPQRVSNAGDFTVGETVTVAGYAARVTGVGGPGSGAPDEVTLDWVAGQPARIPEGTEVTRDVSAMRSGSGIQVKGTSRALDSFQMDGQNDCAALAGQAVQCEGARDPLLSTNSADPFFTRQLLGLNDADLDALVPLTLPDSSGNFPPMVNAVRRIRAQDFDAALKNSDSSGVLIVDGDINSNVNGRTTFDGFIYFRGNQGGKFNGNLTVNGAVAVRGGPIEGLTSDDQTTDLTGNLTVNFNAVQLRRRLLTARGGARLTDTAGSWRQR